MIKELRYEVNKDCNYRCVHCYTDKRKHKSLRIEDIRRVLRDVVGNGGTDLSLTGGEPLLEWRRVLTIAQEARSLGLRVRINTNGHMLNDTIVSALLPVIDEFQVSLNGASSETFDRFVQVKGAFEHVVGGIGRLLEGGGYVTVRYSLTESNADELVATFRLCESLGVQGFKVRTVVPAAPIAAVSSLDGVDKLRRVFAQLSEAIAGSSVLVRFSDGGLGFPRPDLPNYRFLSCLCGADALFVTADGDVMPCPFLREYPSYKLGSVVDEPISAISENSSKLKEFIGDKAPDCGNEQGGGCRAADICAKETLRRPRLFELIVR